MKTFILLLILSFNIYAQEKPAFYAYEIIISSEEEVNLAAWQVELSYDSKTTKITAIEGGDKPFTDPADYDARGLTGGKIILASFTLKKGDLAKEYKVAKVHLFGSKAENLKLKLVIAANEKGKKINAKAYLRKVKKNE